MEKKSLRFRYSSGVLTLDKEIYLRFDRCISLGNIALIDLWIVGAAYLTIDWSSYCLEYKRDDVEEVYGIKARGFIYVVNLESVGTPVFTIAYNGMTLSGEIAPATEPSCLREFFDIHLHRIFLVAPYLLRSTVWSRAINSYCTIKKESNIAGHIDQIFCSQKEGALFIGWILLKNLDFAYLMTEDEEFYSLSDSIRCIRKDVVKNYSPDNGKAFDECGFVFSIKDKNLYGKTFKIVVVTGDGLYEIAQKKLEKEVQNVKEFLDYSLSVHLCQQDRLSEFLKCHVYPLVKNKLPQNNIISMPKATHIGKKLSSPQGTVVIPVYGRYDFIELQLACFSGDEEFKDKIEIIYVIDDPKILTQVLALASEWEFLYDLDVTLLYDFNNRGFSGACNLGAMYAKAGYLIFLNSDVFPIQDGWSLKAISCIAENPDFGIVSIKLIFPNGGIQHCGMSFEWSNSLGVWLNSHPYMGLDPDMLPQSGLIEQEAVTGAFMCVRKSDFFAVGGFDVEYFIGDFEDSDLCLKYKTTLGLRSGVLFDVQMTHLVRQSFPLTLLDDSFRQKIVILNSIRHTERWHEVILKLKGNDAVTSASD